MELNEKLWYPNNTNQKIGRHLVRVQNHKQQKHCQVECPVAAVSKLTIGEKTTLNCHLNDIYYLWQEKPKSWYWLVEQHGPADQKAIR